MYIFTFWIPIEHQTDAPVSQIYLFLHNTLYISEGLSVHHQEFWTVHTATGMHSMSNRYGYLLASIVIIGYSKQNESYRNWLDLPLLVYVCCTVRSRSESGNAYLATWRVSQLVQRIYVLDLLFFDQYVTLVKGLHVESFPTIHSFYLIAWFQ
jgi:hypothetical protein